MLRPRPTESVINKGLKMKLTKESVIRNIQKAGKHLRRVNPTLPVAPDVLIATADKFSLPIGLDMNLCPVARAVFIETYAPDANGAREAGYEAVWSRFEQLSRVTA